MATRWTSVPPLKYGSSEDRYTERTVWQERIHNSKVQLFILINLATIWKELTCLFVIVFIWHPKKVLQEPPRYFFSFFLSQETLIWCKREKGWAEITLGNNRGIVIKGRFPKSIWTTRDAVEKENVAAACTGIHTAERSGVIAFRSLVLLFWGFFCAI